LSRALRQSLNRLRRLNQQQKVNSTDLLIMEDRAYSSLAFLLRNAELGPHTTNILDLVVQIWSVAQMALSLRWTGGGVIIFLRGQLLVSR
jgi:hypothetical protein